LLNLKCGKIKKVRIMNSLILLPTDTSQWHALVHEAQVQRQLVLHEDTESYLVFLLMRFSQSTELLESIFALDFIEALKLDGKRKVNKLQSLGDKSLLLCGLFPGIAEKRSVGIEYYIHIGRTAYKAAGESDESSLYLQLSIDFLDLQKVLYSMRHSTIPKFVDLGFKES